VGFFLILILIEIVIGVFVIEPDELDLDYDPDYELDFDNDYDKTDHSGSRPATRNSRPIDPSTQINPSACGYRGIRTSGPRGKLTHQPTIFVQRLEEAFGAGVAGVPGGVVGGGELAGGVGVRKVPLQIGGVFFG